MHYRNHHAGCCGFNPVRPDGSQWSHVLTLHDGSTVHADTAAEILGELIPGYLTLDDAGRRTARIRLAERLAAAGQEVHIRAALASGALDETSAEDAALIDVLRADKGVSMLLELDGAEGPAPWLPGTPLLLVATQYAPHTDHARLTGNVGYVDPSTEESLLDSLREAQIFDYWREGQRP